MNDQQISPKYLSDTAPTAEEQINLGSCEPESQPPISSQDENRDHSNTSHGDQRFTPGQSLLFVKVRFPGNARSFSFYIGRRKLRYGQKVLAMSDRGVTVGYVNSFPYEVIYQPEMGQIRTINRLATDKDLELQIQHYRQEKYFESVCKRYIENYQLEMNLTHVEFTQFGKKCVFYFTAPARIDFRSLVRDLVQELKIRVELRQISVRDRAAALGGIGPCGLQLCCSSFLSKYGHVSMKMAKNQDLTLASQKLNGVCGMVKCCISYEDDAYYELRSELPEVGQLIRTRNGDEGKVVAVQIYQQRFDLFTTTGHRRRYSAGQWIKPLPGEESKPIILPPNIEFQSDETNYIIGLEEDLQKKRQRLEQDLKVAADQAVLFAQQVWDQLLTQPTESNSHPLS